MKKVLLCGLCCLMFSMFLLTGCTLGKTEHMKLRDLDFVVLSEEKIPKELLKLLNKKKQEPFQLTYSDEQNLFICVGYGEKEKSGYSIVVNALFVAEDGICLNTDLMGPETGEEQDRKSYPYIVVKTELLDLPVNYE